MAKIEQILKVLKIERECIARQSDLSKCDRRCGECDLCLSDEEILEVYDFLIEGYETLQSKGTDTYTVKVKTSDKQITIEEYMQSLKGEN
jgi:hypothetical protein